MRRFLFAQVLVAIAVIAASALAQSGPFREGEVLPAWTPGTLDIHQIVTGRGNAAFMMFPDGTTLLLDAGDAGDTEYDRLHASDADQRPNASHTPAQWIARYIRHMAGSDVRLDYAVLTHFHPDHMGIITGSEPLSTHGDYRLRGITELAEELPIGGASGYLPKIGGDSAELYDPATGVFSRTREMSGSRSGHTATLLLDGTVLIAGGRGPDTSVLVSAELYHPLVPVPAPVLFSLSGDGRGQGAIPHAVTGQVASANKAATAGETLSMYTATLVDGGIIPPEVAVGNRLAEILHFGVALGYPGYYQVNVRVPASAAPGPAVPVRLTYFGRPSNEVTIGVQ